METINTFDYIYEGSDQSETWDPEILVYQCSIEREKDQEFFRIQKYESPRNDWHFSTFYATKYRFHFNADAVSEILAILLQIKERFIWLKDGKKDIENLTTQMVMKKLRELPAKESAALEKELSLKRMMMSNGVIFVCPDWRPLTIFDSADDKPIMVQPILSVYYGIHIKMGRFLQGRDGIFRWLKLEDRLKVRKLLFLDEFIRAMSQAQEYFS